MDLRNVLEDFALKNCADPLKTTNSYSDLDSQIRTTIDSLVAQVKDSMSTSLAEVCNDLNGMWSPRYETEGNPQFLTTFYNTVFGGNLPDKADGRTTGSDYGYCYQNSARLACQQYETLGEGKDEPLAKWDSATQTCVLYDAWYKYKCGELGTGYYLDGVCYIVK